MRFRVYGWSGLLALWVFLVGALPLPAAVFGNQAVIASSTDFTDVPFYSNAVRASVRFTSPLTAPLTQVGFLILNAAGTPGLRVSLQADTALGAPSGIPLAAPTAFTGPWTAWALVSLATPFPLTAGTVYHLVLEWDPTAGSLGPTQNVVIRLSSRPALKFYPQDGSPDPQLSAASDPGSGIWCFLDEQPIFLADASGTRFGNPYGGEFDVQLGSTTLVAWETFSLGAPLTVASVGAFVMESGLASDDLHWEILDAGPLTVLSGGTLANPSQVGATYGWVDRAVPTFVLPPGTYRFDLSSMGSTLPNTYRWEGLYVSTSSGIPLWLTWVSFGYIGSVLVGSWSGPFGPFHLAPELFDASFRLSPPAPPATVPAAPLDGCDILWLAENHFKPSLTQRTRINIWPCGSGRFRVTVYNSAGERIKNLRPLAAPSGPYETMDWDGTNEWGSPVASGLYLIRLEGGKRSDTKRLVVLR